ncbi:unnamed protein product [Clavelina lepadiformis]|uniref:Uncharacterized protein n=1 Tax=Clavelina lepadiformis TaxID=159417 RepID=A0ABP0GSI4_CLALP
MANMLVTINLLLHLLKQIRKRFLFNGAKFATVAWRTGTLGGGKILGLGMISNYNSTSD